MLISSAHNVADDNSLDSYSATLKKLIGPLQSECNVASEWFIENKIFVSPDKREAILFDKGKSNSTNTKSMVSSEKIQVVFFS